MAGEREAYEMLSYFFSRVFDLSLNVVGRPAQADETVVWGEPGVGPCAAFSVSGGRLSGIVLLDAPAELEAARTLVRTRASAAILNDTSGRGTVTLAGLADSAMKHGDKCP
jgi:3-phenylpropionate/trans-cinnamate dioxygenase ferredoxin reductase subunit